MLLTLTWMMRHFDAVFLSADLDCDETCADETCADCARDKVWRTLKNCVSMWTVTYMSNMLSGASQFEYWLEDLPPALYALCGILFQRQGGQMPTERRDTPPPPPTWASPITPQPNGAAMQTGAVADSLPPSAIGIPTAPVTSVAGPSHEGVPPASAMSATEQQPSGDATAQATRVTETSHANMSTSSERPSPGLPATSRMGTECPSPCFPTTTGIESPSSEFFDIPAMSDTDCLSPDLPTTPAMSDTERHGPDSSTEQWSIQGSSVALVPASMSTTEPNGEAAKYGGALPANLRPRSPARPAGWNSTIAAMLSTLPPLSPSPEPTPTPPPAVPDTAPVSTTTRTPNRIFATPTVTASSVSAATTTPTPISPPTATAASAPASTTVPSSLLMKPTRPNKHKVTFAVPSSPDPAENDTRPRPAGWNPAVAAKLSKLPRLSST
ncbi:hypothetical protein CC85DRAFT_163062 [Cutaneotrichosporon oleaginosum]|uniref:Uncharacterized protein n=1 Tax=Cutaneotrichosporon oleaginosum TaxID=879819 RepID=A0A0J0XGD2_9TREE|nr:uncharacterized protein CC85DRAFT_163062 [Cutaneotrichosporon oleaginosum]KLT40121.1 hypothetical protein CC85DRAFT_163062 [Cutaneotrichosporon oleaginosum]TXT04758.1 hypothetical protein COLE_07577 [Cutaneotrichosporon oleaginosum]